MPHQKLFWTRLAGVVVILGCATSARAFQLGSRPAAEWIQTLESPKRVSELKINEIISKLNLKPGMVIADVGSGSGLFSLPMAKAVQPGGKVYAVDIESGLLSYISEKAQKEDVKNIETHLAIPDDAKLPGPVLDLAFFHDSFHHIEHREIYLKNLVKYIKPGGRIVIIDNDKNDPESTHRKQPEMLVAKEDVQKWLEASGFHLVQEVDLFPGKKWFVIYARQGKTE